MNIFYKDLPDILEIGRKDTNFRVSENATESGFSKLDDIPKISNYCLNDIITALSNDTDYKVCRGVIKDLVNTKTGFDPTTPSTYTITNWDKLTDEEKAIASQFFVVPDGLRDTIHTLEEQIQNGIEFHKYSVSSREDRLGRAFSEILNRLTVDDANSLINDIEKDTGVGSLQSLYVSKGREGTGKGDPEGIFDFIESTIGTAYESTGLSARAYTVKSMVDTAELATRVMDIMNNGKR